MDDKEKRIQTMQKVMRSMVEICEKEQLDCSESLWIILHASLGVCENFALKDQKINSAKVVKSWVDKWVDVVVAQNTVDKPRFCVVNSGNRTIN